MESTQLLEIIKKTKNKTLVPVDTVLMLVLFCLSQYRFNCTNEKLYYQHGLSAYCVPGTVLASY